MLYVTMDRGAWESSTKVNYLLRKPKLQYKLRCISTIINIADPRSLCDKPPILYNSEYILGGLYNSLYAEFVGNCTLNPQYKKYTRQCGLAFQCLDYEKMLVGKNLTWCNYGSWDEKNWPICVNGTVFCQQRFCRQKQLDIFLLH